MQLGVGLFEVGNGRHQARVQTAHGNGVLQPGTHGMAGKAFGIADNHRADVFAKGRFQGVGLGAGGTAAGRGIGFMGNKDQLLGNVAAVQAVFFLRVGDQLIHHLCHMSHIQAGNVETAVADFGGQQFGQRLHAAFFHFGLFFHHQGHGPHAHNHAVAAAVKGQRGLGNIGLRRSGAGGQEGRQHPFGNGIVGNVVGADDNHAFGAAQADPVMRHGNGLRRRSARRTHRGGGAFGADPLRKVGLGNNNGL